jgi:Rps23 Pro-64 3,4-dihydroxylase Tpa1-like proline 4-hydroxylase
VRERAPFGVRNDALPAQTVAALLDYVRDNEARFAPATVRSGSERAVNTAVRVSSLLRDLGPFRSGFEDLLRPLADDFARAFGMPPFAVSRFEFELAAHNEGAFFMRHIDTMWDAATRSGRILSGVYYFHESPKGFAGGELRLHTGLAGAAPFTDVAPVHNSLVVFPSWLAHEVLPVRCPSGRFMDSRFAVNCWLHGSAP